MSQYGQYHNDGQVTEATVCILTGRSIEPVGGIAPHTVREKVTGTPYFYRIIAHQYHRVTDDLRAQWRAGIPQVETVEVAPIAADDPAATTTDETSAPKRRRGSAEGEG